MRFTLLCTCACATVNSLALGQNQRLQPAPKALQKPIKALSDATETDSNISVAAEVNAISSSHPANTARITGNAAFTYCDPSISHDSDIFQISSLDIQTAPVKTGHPLILTLTGTLTLPLTPKTLLLTSHTINGHRQHTKSTYMRERLQSASLLSWASAPAASMMPPSDFASSSDEEVEDKMETISEGKWKLVLSDKIESEAEGGEYDVRYRAVTEGWREVFCFEGRVVVEKVNRWGGGS